MFSLRALLAFTAVALAGPTARAQIVDRPGDERPELPAFEAPEQRPLLRDDALPEIPAFEPPERAPGDVLPPFPIPEAADTQGLSGGQRVYVRSVRITGNTVLAKEELSAVTKPYTGRELTFEDIVALADRVTLAYVQRGYVTSGAVIPEQSLADGELELRVVEGVLESVSVETEGRFRPSYFRKRLQSDGPVDVYALERRLQILQQDPRIRALQAQLVPGERRGESVLRVRVDEARPATLRLEANNYQSPAIGEWRGIMRSALTNVTGYGDQARLLYTGGAGIQKIDGHYEVPLTARDTTLALEGKYTWSEVQESAFEDLDIESQFGTVGVELRQPLYRTLESRVSGFVKGEWRRSKTFLLGRGFSFVPGPERGVAKVAVLRFGVDASHSTRRQVFALRSMLSVGLDVLGATHHGDSRIPDGQFVSWLGQLQWARRLPWLGAEALARFDVQLTDSPLLGIEQFAMGGRYTVRGYVENELVRDNGLVGSLELRVPVLPRHERRPWLELGPFVDVGYSWNESRMGPDQTGIKTLVGVGVGARSWLTEAIRLDLNWGYDVRDVSHPGDYALQQDGIYLGLTVDLF